MRVSPCSTETVRSGGVWQAIQTRQPFSFVRIGDGDGEGLLLSLSEDTWLEGLQYLASHFGATRVSVESIPSGSVPPISQPPNLPDNPQSAIPIAQVLAWAAEHWGELIAEWRKYHL